MKMTRRICFRFEEDTGTLDILIYGSTQNALHRSAFVEDYCSHSCHAPSLANVVVLKGRGAMICAAQVLCLVCAQIHLANRR